MNLFPARLAQRERRGPSSVVQVLPTRPRGFCPSVPRSFCPRRCRLRPPPGLLPPRRAEGLPHPWERASAPPCVGGGPFTPRGRFRSPRPASLSSSWHASPSHVATCFAVFCLLFVCRRPFVSAGVGGSFIHCHVSEPRVAGSLEPLDTSLLNSGLAPPETVKGAFSCGEPPCDTGDGSIGFIRILKNECFLLDRGWRRVLTVGYDSLFCHL